MTTRHSQCRRYLAFCRQFRLQPLPTDVQNLCRYVVHLSDALKYSSIIGYLDGLRWFHVQQGLDPPPLDAPRVKLVLRGVKRQLGTARTQKLPITVDVLRSMRSTMDLSDLTQLALWAAFLLAFFSFFRKSNLVPPSAAKFDPKKHLRRGDFAFTPWGVIVTVRWSKVIQFQNKILLIPIARIPRHALCPVSALQDYFDACPASSASPAFLVPSRNGRLTALTYSGLSRHLQRVLLACGLPATEYSSHSFRRGGATFCSSLNISHDLIQLQGDWASMAYLTYLARPLGQRLQLAQQMAQKVAHR